MSTTNVQYLVIITERDGTFKYTVVSRAYLSLLEYNLIYAKINGWIKDWTYL